MNWLQEQKIRSTTTLRVNVKSLAAESKFIRNEISKCNNVCVQSALNNHRVYDVRREARHTQLASACLRGVPYEVVERNAKREPDWQRIENKLKRHVGPWAYQNFECHILDWITKGKAKFRNDDQTKPDNCESIGREVSTREHQDTTTSHPPKEGIIQRLKKRLSAKR